MRPERILLFRSGRHLDAAIAALAAAFPGCEVTVVTTSSGVAALDDAGIPAVQRMIYTRTPFFEPSPFVRSGLWLRALRQRFDRVCVLWTEPDGVGHGNVDRTALLVSPGGFTAITPDGRLVERRTARVLGREVVRATASVGLLLVLGMSVFLPARMLQAIGRGPAC